MWNKGIGHLQYHLKLKSTAESGSGGIPRTSMRSSWQELTPRRPSSFGLGWPTPKLSPGPSWLVGNRARAWAPLSSPIWWPMAMGDYGALEMWLIWNERCCESKAHTIFWRLGGKKSLQNVSWRCFMLITSWTSSIGIYWVRWNALLKLVPPVSFHLFWCGYCKRFSLHCSPAKLPHASPAHLLPSVWEMLHFAVRWRPSCPPGHVFWTTLSACVKHKQTLENNKQDIQPLLYVCVCSVLLLSRFSHVWLCATP